MNIWYINNYAGGPGIGRLYRPYHLADEWKKLGHDTTVFVADFHHLLEKPGLLPPQQSVDGVPYVALKAGTYQGNGLGRIRNMARFCWSLLQFGRALPAAHKKPDVIIVSSPQPFAIFPGHYLARKFNAKLVFEVRDLWPLSLTEINGTSPWHPFVLLAGFAERFAYRKADLVSSLLVGVETYMRERHMPYRKFIWVPNGIASDGESRAPKQSANAEALHTQIRDWKREGCRVLFHPGGLGVPNGILTLVDAFLELRKINPKTKWRAALVGDGGQRDALMQQLQQHGLDQIKVFKPVSKSDIYEIFPETDLGFIGSTGFPAVHKYGVSPNKALDYIKFNKPFISLLGDIGDSFRGYAKVIDVPHNDIATLATTLNSLEKSQLDDVTAQPSSSKHFEYAQIARAYADSFK